METGFFSSPEGRIRDLCRLTLQGGIYGEAYPEAAMVLSLLGH